MKREKIEFISNGKKLIGFINYPKKVPAPGVICFHGGSNNKLKCPSFPALPNALVRAGYIVMRFDFSGSGESEGDFRDKTNYELLKNMKDAINFFANNKKVTKIGITARSQSGLQQSCLYDKRIVCRVIQAPTIDIQGTFDFWYNDTWPKWYKKTKEKYFMLNTGDVRKVRGPYGYNRKYFDEQESVRKLAMKNLPKIKNTLIMQGNVDKEVKPEMSWEIYNLMSKPKEYHIIDGAGHPFVDKDKEVVSLALAWLNKWLK